MLTLEVIDFIVYLEHAGYENVIVEDGKICADKWGWRFIAISLDEMGRISWESQRQSKIDFDSII